MKGWMRGCAMFLVGAVVAEAAAAQSLTQSAGGGQGFSVAQPGLAMRHVFVKNGLYPYRDTGYVQGDTMAMVRLWAGTTMPYAEPAADGTLLQIQQHAILNSIIVNTYGGDGLITIATPNLAGRHAASMGAAPGGISRIPGDAYGVPAASLVTQQMPPHRHTVGVAPDVLDTGLVGGGLALDLHAPTLTLRHVIAVDGSAPNSGAFPFVGMVRSFAGTYDTGEWLHADGRLLPVATCPTLFQVIGNRYGGDGTSTFALPDLRGRVIAGAGATPWGSTLALGQIFGASGVVLGDAQLGPHAHGLPGSGQTSSTGGGQPFDNAQPTMALDYYIVAQGLFPSYGGGSFPADDATIGEVFAYAGTQAPNPQLFRKCEGQLLPIQGNEALFQVIGTTWGGDGVTTFALPDLRGRVPIGTGPGYPAGSAHGAPTSQLTSVHLPSHVHGIPPIVVFFDGFESP